MTRKEVCNVSTIKELVALATEQKKPISEIMIEQKMEMTQQSRGIWGENGKNLQTMKNAVERSVEGGCVLSNGNGWRCVERWRNIVNVENIVGR